MARKITDKLLNKLAAEQQNAWGQITLDTIVVDVIYPGGKGLAFELQIEPNIILQPRTNTWIPGVVYNPHYTNETLDDDMPDVGEIVAYAINEGEMTSDTIEDHNHIGPIKWQVRNVKPLKTWGVL
jgi:hypothetical protein